MQRIRMGWLKDNLAGPEAIDGSRLRSAFWVFGRFGRALLDAGDSGFFVSSVANEQRPLGGLSICRVGPGRCTQCRE